MPALASISVNDAEATPVAHVFSPVTTDGSLARFANRDADTPAGFETLSIELRAPVSSTAAYRAILKGTFPTEATVDGTPQVVKLSSFEIAINLSQKSTAQERLNVLKILSNLLASSVMEDVIENVEPIY